MYKYLALLLYACMHNKWTLGLKFLVFHHVNMDFCHHVHLYLYDLFIWCDSIIFCSVVWGPARSGERPFDRSAEVTLWHPCSGTLPVLRGLLPASHPHRSLPGRRELGETQDHLHKVWVFGVYYKPLCCVIYVKVWKQVVNGYLVSVLGLFMSCEAHI